uniref:CS domain-containing protein n=1 Tax=Globodera rostochiensis TaxID=31243 RepID=A0A914HEI5_GLORO
MIPIAIKVNRAAQKTVDRHNRYGLSTTTNFGHPRETVWVRDDWYEQFGQVHISIYGRGTVRDGTHAESDGLKLKVTLVHAFGAKESVKEYNLYGEIVPSSCVMLISEKKVELVLKQLHREKWMKLCYDGGQDGAVCCDADDDGAFLELDDVVSPV